MESTELFALIFIILVAVFSASLVVIGERSVDAYAVLSILSYYISLAFFHRGLRNRRPSRLLDAILIIILLIIVIYRVIVVPRQ